MSFVFVPFLMSSGCSWDFPEVMRVLSKTVRSSSSSSWPRGFNSILSSCELIRPYLRPLFEWCLSLLTKEFFMWRSWSMYMRLLGLWIGIANISLKVHFVLRRKLMLKPRFNLRQYLKSAREFLYLMQKCCGNKIEIKQTKGPRKPQASNDEIGDGDQRYAGNDYESPHEHIFFFPWWRIVLSLDFSSRNYSDRFRSCRGVI